MSTAALGPGLAILGGGAAGAWLLRRAWTRRTQGHSRMVAAGWLILLVSLLWPAWVLGSARGPFFAIALLSAAALAIVASGIEIRAARAQRDGGGSLAPEPLERPSTAWRGALRWLLAGPIGMVAAMAVGVCYAVWVPGAPQTRLLIGGLIVPVAWGGAMAWTLADNRILRATAVLVGTAIVGFGASALKGFS